MYVRIIVFLTVNRICVIITKCTKLKSLKIVGNSDDIGDRVGVLHIRDSGTSLVTKFLIKTMKLRKNGDNPLFCSCSTNTTPLF